MYRRKIIIFAFLGLILLLNSCRLSISMSGSNIDERATTVYVATFTNNASLINPSLSQDLTTELKNQIQNQTPLTIVNQSNADYSIEGSITNYSISPVAIQGDDVAAMNRLTITVNVSFENSFNENENFNSTFSRYVDYPSSQNFTAIESSLVAEINTALTEDIFNKAFVNW